MQQVFAIFEFIGYIGVVFCGLMFISACLTVAIDLLSGGRHG